MLQVWDERQILLLTNQTTADVYDFGIDVRKGISIRMLCCLIVIPKLLSDRCFWQMMDEGEKGWLQEGFYALRRDNAHC